MYGLEPPPLNRMAVSVPYYNFDACGMNLTVTSPVELLMVVC